MKEEWAKDLVAWPWCISQVVKAHEDCPELQTVLDEYHKPVVIQDQVLGELTLDKDHDVFEGEIQWRGKDVLLSLEVNAESKPPGPAPAVPPRSCWPTVKPGTRPCESLQPRT